MSSEPLRAAIADLRLVDQHMHAVLPGRASAADFERLLTESDREPRAGTSRFDSQLGWAIRRCCAPVLGLPPFPEPAEYVRHRDSLTGTRPSELLLSAAACSYLLVDTGYAVSGSAGVAELAELSGSAVRQIVRIESVAEELAATGCTAASFGSRFAELLWQRSADAVALKSIVAYRYGLDFDASRPSEAEVLHAASSWLRAVERQPPRLTDPVLLRHLLWSAAERGLPLQLHTGFGDPDIDLRRADPSLAREFIATCGVPVVLLHCYPYHRQAGYLAQAYPNVYTDVGLTLNYTGAQAPRVLAESLELAPFGQVLYSSDGYGLPELIYLGARQWRDAMTEVLGGWVAAGQCTEPDAIRLASMMGAANAMQLYQLPEA